MDDFFSDLIPTQGAGNSSAATAGSGLFDDLLPQDAGLLGMPKEAAKGVARGAVSATGTAMVGLSAPGARDPAEEQAYSKLIADLPRVKDMDAREYADFTRRATTGIRGGNEMNLLAIASQIRAGKMDPADIPQEFLDVLPKQNIEDTALYKAGQATKEYSQEKFGAAPDYVDSWTAAITEGLGSTAPFLIASVVPGGAALSVGAGMGMSSGEAIERAQGKGATREQVMEAGRLGYIPGLTEQIPIEVLLNKVPMPIAGRFGAVLGKVLTQAAAEGGQEAVQQTLQNIIANYTYDPNQPLTEDVLKSFAVGAAVGGVMGAAAAPFEGRQAEPTTPEPGAVENIPAGSVPAERLIGAEQEGQGAPTEPLPVPAQAQQPATPAPAVAPEPSPEKLVDKPQQPSQQAVAPVPADSDPERVNSPRLTPEDRASPLPNNLIDDGKAIVSTLLGETEGARNELPETSGTPAPDRGGALPVAAAPDTASPPADVPLGSGVRGEPDAVLSAASEPASRPVLPRIETRPIKPDTIQTPTGKRFDVEYAIVDLDSLVPSNFDDGRINPAYPQERQPRDRTKGTYESQYQEIISKFDPRQLDESPTSDNGAPIVDESGVVESGNGRIITLGRVYRDRPDLAQKYINHLVEKGYPVPGAADRTMRKPVLVRVRKTAMNEQEIAEYTRASNIRTSAEMSDTEMAMADANTLQDFVLDLYRGGDIDSAQNRDFVRGFMAAAVAKQEHGKIVDDKTGEFSQAGIRRIRAALIAKAYGDPNLVSNLFETQDTEIKAIGNALLSVSAKWAQMRARARAGDIDPRADQTDALLEAVRTVQRARREGKKVFELVNQRDVFSGQAMSTEAEAFLRIMFRDTEGWTKPVSQDKLAAALDFYVTAALQSAPGVDMFGQAGPAPAEMLATAKKKQEASYAGSTEGQAGLDFTAPRPNDPGRNTGPASPVRAEPAVEGGEGARGGNPAQEGARPERTVAPAVEQVEAEPEAAPVAKPTTPKQEELKAKMAERAAERETEQKPQAPALDLTPPPEPAKDAGKIEDFGEVLEGARKMMHMRYADDLKEDIDIASVPLSKSFPQPNYVKLAESGVAPDVLAAVALMRDMIPVKPRTWKLKRWTQQVTALREFASKLISGEISVAEFTDRMKNASRDMREVAMTINAIAGTNPEMLPLAAKFRIKHNSYTFFMGERYEGGKWLYTIVDPNGRTMASSQTSDSNRFFDEDADTVVAKARKEIAEYLLKQADKPTVDRDKYTALVAGKDRDTNEYFIAFKVGREVIRVKGGFADMKALREYIDKSRDEIQAKIDEIRAGPNERLKENRDRTGPKLREGDIAPEKFQQIFGFRGVQFGNYVEGERRQSDLNQAYDALMDLADAVGIPPKAISLNGSLGLAFGARGKGGKRAAMAHFEPGNIVINLTKGSGPGSLAHEWLHALDNYFARQAKGGSTPAYISQDGPGAVQQGAMRESVYEAWRGLAPVLRASEFYKRSAEFDKARSKPYWSTTIEMAARSFEKYIVDRLAKSGFANDYLANIDTSGGAYPTDKEMLNGITAAWDNLFAAIESRPTEAGEQLFSLRTETETYNFGGNELRVDLVSRFDGAADRLEASMRKSLDKLGLADVGLRVLDSIRLTLNGNESYANGRYFKGLIDVALSADDPHKTLQHEAVHALRRLGAFTDKEWEALERKSRQSWMAKYNIDQAYGFAPEKTRVEEGIAHAYADWHAGKMKEVGIFRQAFEKIKAIINAIRSALRGEGFNTPEQIFGMIASGQIGARARNRGAENLRFAVQSRDGDLFAEEVVETADGPRVQLVIPGAEKITDKERAERQAEGRKLPDKEQKTVDGLPLFGDEKDQMSLFQMPQPTFFSAALRAASEIQQPKGNAQQWYAMISKAAGVKPEELEWLGLKEWLDSQTGAITKEAVVDFIRSNQITVSETAYGAGAGAAERSAPAYRNRLNGMSDEELANEAANIFGTGAADELERFQYDSSSRDDTINELVQEYEDSAGYHGVDVVSRTKFEQYTLPGGQNYRELLLTLQAKDPVQKSGLIRVKDDDQADSILTDMSMDGLESLDYGRSEDGSGQITIEIDNFDAVSWEQVSEIAISNGAVLEGTTQAGTQETYRSSHWEPPNVLAHVRFSERAQGDKRALHIEEIQSDWHQAGRKRGYKQPQSVSAAQTRAAQAVIDEKIDGKFAPLEIVDRGKVILELVRESHIAHWQLKGVITAPEALVLRNGVSNLRQDASAVPNAPFKTTWPELAFKRMLRYAVDNGFDRIVWTPGEAQAERYDLSKRIDSLGYKKLANGSYLLNAQTRERGGVPMGEHTADQLADQVGKDVADKIINGEGVVENWAATNEQRNEWKVLRGLDLKVGGEGMIGFYDKILPATVNKMAKKWGGKVETSKIATGDVKKYDLVDRGGGWRIIDLETDRGEYVGPLFRSGEDAEKWLAENGLTDKEVWSLDITPQMREAVAQGLPLFQLRQDPATVEDNKRLMLGFISRGQPIDSVMRIPFAVFGGVDNDGRWNWGKKLTAKSKDLIVNSKVGGDSAFAEYTNRIIERARQGLLDRYGLSQEYIRTERERALDERAILEQGEEFLTILQREEITPDEAKVLQALLTGEQIDNARLKSLSEPIVAAIDDLGNQAVELGLISRESYERNKGAYLHRVYMKHETGKNGIVRMVDSLGGAWRKRIVGSELKGRGIFLKVTLDKLMRGSEEWIGGRKGNPAIGDKFRVIDEISPQTDALNADGKPKVIRRIYMPADMAVPAKYTGAAFRDQGIWEVRGKNGKEYTVWRDYTKAERTSMGEILDARYTIGKTFMLLANDLATGKFFKKIAENEQWVRAKVDEGQWRNPMDRDAGQEWVKVPETEIAGTGGKKRYGAIAGKFIRPEIWRDIAELERMQTPTAWRSLLTQWKLNKALALDTPIPTPTGWTTMGEIKVGDKVFDEKGSVCTVLEVKDVQYGRPCFEVVFSDGEVIVADEDHWWYTFQRNKGGGVRTTKEIAATLKTTHRQENAHSIPVAGRLDLPHADLPIPPYAMGYWLGDGSVNSPRITVGEAVIDELASHLQSAGIHTGKRCKDKRSSAVSMQIDMQPIAAGRAPNLFNEALKAMGLKEGKRIPQQYLRASEDQRVELLQGLMDSDGWITTRGDCGFGTSFPALRDGAMELLRSLGYKPHCRETISASGRPTWRIHFKAYAQHQIFRLSTKASRLVKRPNCKARSESRMIVDIRPVASVPVRCIAVSSESSLYLAGEGMIPTHNTSRNPVVHLNNIMSNMVLADMMDVTAADIVRGIRSYISSDEMYREALKHGAMGVDMIAQEIRENHLRPMLEKLVQESEGATSWEDRGTIIGKLAQIWDTLAKLDESMRNAYSAEDDIFRMALFVKRRRAGDDAYTAADAARTQFIDYDIRSPWINAARNSLLPFVGYTYRAVPLIAQAMVERPWKLAKYATMAYAANGLAYAALGLDDDDEERERASMRDQEQGYTWLGSPRMIRLPYNDANGLPMFMDIRRWVPAGDVFDTGQGSSVVPIPAPLQFGGPLMLAAELWLNKSAFTGEDIRGEYDTLWEKFQKGADYTFKAFAPSAPWIPNSWYWDKIGNAISGATDAVGRPYSVPQAILSSVGIKIRPQDVESGIYWRGVDMRKEGADLKNQARALARQRARNLISQEAYESKLAVIVLKTERLAERMRELGEIADR